MAETTDTVSDPMTTDPMTSDFTLTDSDIDGLLYCLEHPEHARQFARQCAIQVRAAQACAYAYVNQIYLSNVYYYLGQIRPPMTPEEASLSYPASFFDPNAPPLPDACELDGFLE